MNYAGNILLFLIGLFCLFWFLLIAILDYYQILPLFLLTFDIWLYWFGVEIIDLVKILDVVLWKKLNLACKLTIVSSAVNWLFTHDKRWFSSLCTFFLWWQFWKRIICIFWCIEITQFSQWWRFVRKFSVVILPFFSFYWFFVQFYHFLFRLSLYVLFYFLGFLVDVWDFGE